MKRQTQARTGMDWEQGRVNLGCHAGLFANMREIRREAVTQINGGRGDAVPLQKQPLSDPRLRIKMGNKLGRESGWNSRRMLDLS
jgi:hypothetical protein